MTDDRLRIWLSFAKFILGSVVLGIVTAVINWQIQEREIAIKDRQALREIEMEEMRQLGTFVNHALSDSVYIRRRFAQYFASVTRAPDT